MNKEEQRKALELLFGIDIPADWIRTYPSLSMNQLERIEREFLDAKLPNDYRDFLLITDGMAFLDIEIYAMQKESKRNDYTQVVAPTSCSFLRANDLRESEIVVNKRHSICTKYVTIGSGPGFCLCFPVSCSGDILPCVVGVLAGEIVEFLGSCFGMFLKMQIMQFSKEYNRDGSYNESYEYDFPWPFDEEWCRKEDPDRERYLCDNEFIAYYGYEPDNY